jgi:hypothetical protein
MLSRKFRQCFICTLIIGAGTIEAREIIFLKNMVQKCFLNNLNIDVICYPFPNSLSHDEDLMLIWPVTFVELRILAFLSSQNS